MSSTEGFVERAVRGVERRIEEWREEDRRRRIEVEENRRNLWEEAAERERLLAEIVHEEEARDLSPEEVVKEKRVVFVMHSEEAGRALQEFSEGRVRLSGTIPGRGDRGRRSGLQGTWLVFEKH